MSRRPTLRTILLLVNIVIIALPLAGIAALRLYESALVRQTESSLIAQAAFVAAAYEAALRRVSSSLTDYGVPVDTARLEHAEQDGRWRPRPARLDLATVRVLPRPPDAVLAAAPADAAAAAAGHEIMPMMRNAQVVTLASIRVTDYRGTVVASTGEDLHRSLGNWEEVARALKAEHVSSLHQRVSDEPPPPFESISRGGRVRVFVAMPIIAEDRLLGAAVLSRTPANIAQTLYGKRRQLLYAGLGLLAVVLAVSLLTSFTIRRPVMAVMQQAERAVRGERGAVVPLARPGIREIEQLSEAVARMARTLEQRADYIRDFASNVSHEFKTPLTAIGGTIELLQEYGDTMSTEERARFIRNLEGDASYLQRLVQRLLDLARADVIKVGSDESDVDRVLRRVVELYHRRGLELHLEGDAEPTAVAINEDVLESIISNLLENARQHAGDDVNVTIKISRRGAGEEQEVIILAQDNGPGISEANATRIFRPFFTTARTQGGTGLGLAAVKSLLTAHHGDIRLLRTTTGAAFELQLPVKHWSRLRTPISQIF